MPASEGEAVGQIVARLLVALHRNCIVLGGHSFLVLLQIHLQRHGAVLKEQMK